MPKFPLLKRTFVTIEGRAKNRNGIKSARVVASARRVHAFEKWTVARGGAREGVAVM